MLQTIIITMMTTMSSARIHITIA